MLSKIRHRGTCAQGLKEVGGVVNVRSQFDLASYWPTDWNYPMRDWMDLHLLHLALLKPWALRLRVSLVNKPKRLQYFTFIYWYLAQNICCYRISSGGGILIKRLELPSYFRSKFGYESKKDGSTLTLEDLQGTNTQNILWILYILNRIHGVCSVKYYTFPEFKLLSSFTSYWRKKGALWTYMRNNKKLFPVSLDCILYIFSL